ncbi:hypothetical protein acsn021_42470 [Anaerocolumna cellulosilytica]|uniref:Uncharacterized protein n=1 Tax=Anaerocolumna cellulosilytica TaxID=433286 RepID=A0A6S6RCZ3_9FIRM|nr:HD domain-containing phosphohydrolase [Anaerocolumna cellulosilytica]MBB5195205.1 putative nucleotidyltransferase with HDIG domain [Anaerocolumna cellulosilytica]BCJ96678.1 hypothetical protein acsn021_42470 [Anaerocolumna cellulosilytica]
MLIKIKELLNINVLEKTLNDFYKIIKVPIAIVDNSGELIVCAGWNSVCSDISCSHEEFHRMCLNEYWKNNSGCLHCKREISCLNGLKMYRIPVYYRDYVTANIFLYHNADIINSSILWDLLVQFFESFAITFGDYIAKSYKSVTSDNQCQIDYEELKVSYEQLNAVNEQLRFKIWELTQVNVSGQRRGPDTIEPSHKKSIMDAVAALSYMVEKKDSYTAKHQKKVALLACKIASKLKMDKNRLEGLYISAMLHDIGKVGVPSAILTKPDKLTKTEFELIKGHVECAYDILSKIDFPWPVADIVLQHHEKINGSGYPYGLTDKEILLEAKIISVADVVEAITAHRPYKPAFSITYAMEEIKKYAGVYYDAEVVEACVKVCTENLWRELEESNFADIHFIR